MKLFLAASMMMFIVAIVAEAFYLGISWEDRRLAAAATQIVVGEGKGDLLVIQHSAEGKVDLPPLALVPHPTADQELLPLQKLDQAILTCKKMLIEATTFTIDDGACTP